MGYAEYLLVVKGQARIPCSEGGKCTDKRASHKEEYSHPGDSDWLEFLENPRAQDCVKVILEFTTDDAEETSLRVGQTGIIQSIKNFGSVAVVKFQDVDEPSWVSKPKFKNLCVLSRANGAKGGIETE